MFCLFGMTRDSNRKTLRDGHKSQASIYAPNHPNHTSQLGKRLNADDPPFITRPPSKIIIEAMYQNPEFFPTSQVEYSGIRTKFRPPHQRSSTRSRSSSSASSATVRPSSRSNIPLSTRLVLDSRRGSSEMISNTATPFASVDMLSVPPAVAPAMERARASQGSVPMRRTLSAPLQSLGLPNVPANNPDAYRLPPKPPNLQARLSATNDPPLQNRRPRRQSRTNIGRPGQRQIPPPPLQHIPATEINLDFLDLNTATQPEQAVTRSRVVPEDDPVQAWLDAQANQDFIGRSN